MKRRLIAANFNHETGESYARIGTRYGEFEGFSRVHPEDAENISSMAGCRYAEIKAVIKAYIAKKKDLKIRLSAIENLEKDLKNMAFYNPWTIEMRKIRKTKAVLTKEINETEAKIKKLRTGLTDTIAARDEMLKIFKDKSK